MSLNAQAIAVSGYGYGPQLIAVSGYGFIEAEIEDLLHSGHGDNGKRKLAYKPTGLGGYKKKPVTQIEERIELQEETVLEAKSELSRIFEQDTEVIQMSLVEIDNEIKFLMQKEFKNREEEALLVILIAAYV